MMLARQRLLVGGAGLGIVLLFVAAFVGPSPRQRGPAFIPSQSATPAETLVAGIRHVTAPDAPQTIVFDSVPPDLWSRLLWFEGRSTQPAEHGVVVVDQNGSLLRFDGRLNPGQPLLELGGRMLTSAAGAPGGALWVTDAAGNLLQVDDNGHLLRTRSSPYHHPVLAADPALTSAILTRSSQQFEFAWDSSPAPVVTVAGHPGGQDRGLGKAMVPAHALLTDLANAGHIATDGARVFYAPFIRDEIVALQLTGETLWVAHRRLPQTTEIPRFEVQDGKAVINYHPVNLGTALGPDGHLYVLSTPGFTTSQARLDVFEPATGRLVRSGTLNTPLPTLAVDSGGRVYLLDPARLLKGAPAGARQLAPVFDVPELGGGRASSEGLRGKVVLLNVWASWCEPCRTEMPALDSLWRRVNASREDSSFVFLGLNDEHDTTAARRFVEEFHFAFPVGLAREKAKSDFHFPGLPYTLLIDRDGRVIRRWIGYIPPEERRLAEVLIRREVDRVGEAGAEAGSRTVHRH